MERLNPASPLTCPFTCAKPVMERMGIRRSLFFSLRLHAHARRFEINELEIIQAAVGTELLYQFLVRTHVGDGAVIDHHNSVGATHSGKAMCDNHHGAS